MRQFAGNYFKAPSRTCRAGGSSRVVRGAVRCVNRRAQSRHRRNRTRHSATQRMESRRRTPRYVFQEAALKGIGVGGAVRYQAVSIMSYDGATGATEKSNETLFGDAFANYRRKAPWGKGSMLLRFNVTNIKQLVSLRHRPPAQRRRKRDPSRLSQRAASFTLYHDTRILKRRAVALAPMGSSHLGYE